MDATPKKNCRIKYFPVSFFSIIMGLSGFVIALQKAQSVLKLPISFSPTLLTITISIFLIFSFVYLLKIIFFSKEVIEEFNNPIKLSFFPTFSISLLLISIALLSVSPVISKYFWIIGTAVHLFITLKIISIWIQHSKFEIKHMNPAWFIPAVGNILVPVAGVTHFSPEISWFFFSIGFVFWVVLFIIFFNRSIFHQPLVEKLLPTYFILIAPPAVGFISYIKLTENLNDFARILYYFALFLTILMLFQLKMFRNLKYYLSWWAYSFPISAITIASILFFHLTGSSVFMNISYALLILLSLIIIILITKTIQAIYRREICVEEK